MTVIAGEMTGSYGLRAPAMVTLGVASVTVGDRAISTSQPATRAGPPVRRRAFTFA
jgi:H+/Cl- antiporter ClcA